MYNLNANEILMVDGGGDGNRPSSSRNPTNGHTTYGGQGGGFVGTSHGNGGANSCLGGILGNAGIGAVTGAMKGGGLGGAVVGGSIGAVGGLGGCM